MPAIRMVRIVPQVVKVRGVEIEVACKQLRFFPKINPKSNSIEGFGILKNQPWQVCIQRANWKDEDVVKVRYYDKNGRFSIVYNEQLDPVDPWDKRWEPGKVRKVVNRIDGLNNDDVEKELARICKVADPSLPKDQQPVDHEFIEMVLGELILAAESARKVA